MIADFGIALAVTHAAGGRLTETGLSLGTPGYMSPEQAVGDRDLSGQTDIYSLASVTYEMLAGDPPFAGNNVHAVMAKVVNEEPTPVTTIRPAVPVAVDTALRKALAKVPTDRHETAAAFARAIDSGTGPAVAPRRARRGWVLGGSAATAMAIAMVASNMIGSRGAEPTSLELTTRQITNYLGREFGPSWSPDGSMMTFGYTAEGHMDVFVMATSGGNPIRLTTHPGDDVSPRWSPRGDYIAYIGNRNGLRVYIVPPTGGEEREVADTRATLLDDQLVWFRGLGAEAWSPDGTQLLFPRRDSTGSISTWRVDINTGETVRVTSAPAGALDLGASWARDGRTILFDRGTWGQSDLWQVRVDGGDGSPEQLTNDGAFDFNPSAMPDGNVAFISSRSADGATNICQLNPQTREVQPVTRGTTAVFAMTSGPTGQIAYSEAGHVNDLYWGDGSRDVDAHVNLTRTTTDDFGARISSDGTKVVYQSGPLFDPNTDIWVYDRTVGQRTRLLASDSFDEMPEWLPNGDVVFSSTDAESGQESLRVITPGEVEPRLFGTVTGVGCEFTFCRSGANVSPDGEAVGFLVRGPNGRTLWTAKPDGADLRATELSAVRSFDWYGDSKRVVYTRRSPEEGLELRAAHLETGEDILLLATPAVEPEVRPGGTAVAFLRGDSHYNMNVFLLRLTPPAGDLGLPRPIGTPEPLVDGQGVWHVHNFAWNPAGNGFVYTRDEDDGDIFVLDPVAR